VGEPAKLPLAAGSGAEAVSLRARPAAWLWIFGAVAFLLGSLLAGAFVGPVHIGPGAIVEAAASRIPLLGIESPLSPTEEAILFEIRLPRVVLACLVGAMLASAGASYQGVFRNPLADPYLLGVAAGAGLGATLAVAYGPPGAKSAGLLPLSAFVGGAGAVAAAYAIGRSAGGRNPTALILAGVVIASFLTAVQTFVQQQNLDTIQEVYSWILGRLSTAGWREVALVAPYVGVSAAGLLIHRRLLDVLAVGDEEARSLGVHVRRVRLVVIAAATLGTAAAVAVSGLIGFVGIIVPHAIRLLAGTSYRLLLPLSLLCGAGFLVLADVLARTALSPGELPIGVVTAFFGAPFFVVVLRTTRTVGP
jgi:iron complex transport system permease protein